LRSPATLPAAFFFALAVVAIRDAVAGRRLVRLGVLAALAAVSLAATAWPHRLIREMERSGAVTIAYVKPGLELYHRGDIDGGLALLERAVAENPDAAGDIAKMLEGDRSNDAVRRFVDRLYAGMLEASTNPTQSRVNARIRAAVELLQHGRPAEALLEIDSALALDPFSWDLHNVRARILARLGRWEQAGEAFARAFTYGRNVEPDVGQAWLDMAGAALRSGRLEQAREYLGNARFVDPSSVEAIRLGTEID
jgi:tetratricopeptide (TPR) repeat protein